MVTFGQFEEFADRIRRGLDPERIILFGSHATGQAKEDSDVDLLVVAEMRIEPRKRYHVVRELLADIPVAFDIIVRTPDEYEAARSVVNNIEYFADKYGKVLYERSCPSNH